MGSLNETCLPEGFVLDGRFRIREIVSQGGMSTIYRGEDLDHQGSEVAIKIPLAKVEADPVGFARFLNEERIGSQLSHPFLLKVHVLNGEKSRPYLATEFVRGQTLDLYRHEARPLPEAEALRIAGRVCEAMAHMHDRGFVHGDLKPGNIMICADGTVRILDFGLAGRTMPAQPHCQLTPLLGTPQYMAPEQVNQGLIDERTDIYCLGALLYELLTGATPLAGDDPWESADQRRTTGDPIAPRKLNPALSAEAEEIVLHAVADPAGRHSRMPDLKAELEAPERVRVTGYSERLRIHPAGVSELPRDADGGRRAAGMGVILFLVIVFTLVACPHRRKIPDPRPAGPSRLVKTKRPSAPSSDSRWPATIGRGAAPGTPEARRRSNSQGEEDPPAGTPGHGGGQKRRGGS